MSIVRKITRIIVAALVGIQIAYAVLFIYLGNLSGAKTPFSLAIWMVLVLILEARVHSLEIEKENLRKFLENPSDSAGGEMD